MFSYFLVLMELLDKLIVFLVTASFDSHENGFFVVKELIGDPKGLLRFV